MSSEPSFKETGKTDRYQLFHGELDIRIRTNMTAIEPFALLVHPIIDNRTKTNSKVTLKLLNSDMPHNWRGLDWEPIAGSGLYICRMTERLENFMVY
jgi:hypothetical protein